MSRPTQVARREDCAKRRNPQGPWDGEVEHDDDCAHEGYHGYDDHDADGHDSDNDDDDDDDNDG